MFESQTGEEFSFSTYNCFALLKVTQPSAAENVSGLLDNENCPEASHHIWTMPLLCTFARCPELQVPNDAKLADNRARFGVAGIKTKSSIPVTFEILCQGFFWDKDHFFGITDKTLSMIVLWCCINQTTDFSITTNHLVG